MRAHALRGLAQPEVQLHLAAASGLVLRQGQRDFYILMFMTPWLISAARGERISVSPLGVG